jgi:hypothetical protein
MKDLMKKLLNATPNADKLQHFFYGAIIYTLVWVFFGIVGSTQQVQLIMATGVVNIVAWAKEFYVDKRIGGHTSVWDAVYTILPCVLFGLVLIFGN